MLKQIIDKINPLPYITSFFILTFLNKIAAAAAPGMQGGADSIVLVMCKIFLIFTGPMGQAIIIFVIIFSSISMLFGKMTWITAGMIVIGITFMFGASNIASQITGRTLDCQLVNDLSIIP